MWKREICKCLMLNKGSVKVIFGGHFAAFILLFMSCVFLFWCCGCLSYVLLPLPFCCAATAVLLLLCCCYTVTTLLCWCCYCSVIVKVIVI